MNNDIFEKYSIPKAVLSLALPTMLSMLVTVIYNLADTFFVGQTGDPNQVAAVTLSTPIYFIMLSISNIFSIGGASYISRLLGKKEYDKVKKVSAFCVYGGAFIAIIASLIVLVFLPFILKLIGTSPETYEFSKDYIIILAIGSVFICLQIIFSGIVRSEGAAKQSMIGMSIGTILNIILDPIFIINFDMGVSGAAIATVIGGVASTIYYIIYLLKTKKTNLTLSIKHFSAEKDIVKNVLMIGIPVSINNLLMSLSTIVLNNFAATYGDNIVAALGIASRINMISILLFVGLSQGIQPFIGYNFSAKNFKRMNGAIKFSSVFSVIIGSIILTFLMMTSEIISKLFINNEEVIPYAKSFINVLMSTAPFVGIMFVFMGTLQAMGKAIPSLILSVCRQGLIYIPVIIIGNALLGLDGIVWAQPSADTVTTFLAIIFYLGVYKKIKHLEPEIKNSEKPNIEVD